MTDLKKTRKRKPLALKKQTLGDLTVKQARQIKGGAYNADVPTVPCASIGNPVTCYR